jgi:hypothetical protein
VHQWGKRMWVAILVATNTNTKRMKEMGGLMRPLLKALFLTRGKVGEGGGLAHVQGA